MKEREREEERIWHKKCMSSSVLKKNRHESIWYDIEKLIVAEQDV